MKIIIIIRFGRLLITLFKPRMFSLFYKLLRFSALLATRPRNHPNDQVIAFYCDHEKLKIENFFSVKMFGFPGRALIEFYHSIVNLFCYLVHSKKNS